MKEEIDFHEMEARCFSVCWFLGSGEGEREREREEAKRNRKREYRILTLGVLACFVSLFCFKFLPFSCDFLENGVLGFWVWIIGVEPRV